MTYFENIAFPNGRLESALGKVMLVFFLFLISFSYSIDQAKIVGTWDVEIKFNDGYSNETNAFVEFLSMHTLSNIFKQTNEIIFKNDGTLKVDKRFGSFPNYYFLDIDNQLLYLFHSPINKNRIIESTKEVIVFEMEVNNNESFLINMQSDKEQQLVLKKQ